MDWNLFWTAFGAIGGTVGAIATAAAVIVALWQTKYSYKKKLKISFSNNITIVPENGSNFYHYVGVTITNIGNRDVIIKNWGFFLNNGSKMMIIPDTSPIGRILQVQLPHKLQVEEGVSLYYSNHLFKHALEECIANGSLSNNKKIRFFVTDSTEKEHFVTTHKTAQDLLSDSIQYEKRISQNQHTN